MRVNVAASAPFVIGLCSRYSDFHYSFDEERSVRRVRLRRADARSDRPRSDAVGVRRLPLSLLACVRKPRAEREGVAPADRERHRALEERRSGGRAAPWPPQAAPERARLDHGDARALRAAAVAAVNCRRRANSPSSAFGTFSPVTGGEGHSIHASRELRLQRPFDNGPSPGEKGTRLMLLASCGYSARSTTGRHRGEGHSIDASRELPLQRPFDNGASPGAWALVGRVLAGCLDGVPLS